MTSATSWLPRVLIIYSKEEKVMENIKILVRDKRAIVEGSPVIICGNSDYVVAFDFDDEWSATGPKTARFVYVKEGEVQHEDVVFSDATAVPVPVLSDVSFVKVGVFEGDLCTTTPARIPCEASILCGSGELQEPSEEVYNQIMALLTELVEQGASGATEEQVRQIEQNTQDIKTNAETAAAASEANAEDIKTNTEAIAANKKSIEQLNESKMPAQFNYNGGADAHDITTPGICTVGAECANLPFDTGWGIMLVSNLDNNPAYTNQILFSVDNMRWYAKQCENGVWPDKWEDNFNGLRIETPDGMVALVSNSEGGNLQVKSPKGATWEMDANNEDFRVFRYPNTGGDYVCFYFHKSGAMSVPGTIYSNGKVVPTVGTKVWENSSPDYMSELTVSVDFTEYTEFEVVYAEELSGGVPHYIKRTGRLPVKSYTLSQALEASVKSADGTGCVGYVREYRVWGGSDGGLSFDCGYGKTAEGETVDTTSTCIPLQIIAY